MFMANLVIWRLLRHILGTSTGTHLTLVFPAAMLPVNMALALMFAFELRHRRGLA